MSKCIVMALSGEESTLESEALPEVCSLDLEGWNGLSLERSGVHMFMFRIEADAVEFPIHESEFAWLAYVIEGSGTLYAGVRDSEKTTGIGYSTGDFIVFEPNTPHGWLTDGTPGRILFARRG